MSPVITQSPTPTQGAVNTYLFQNDTFINTAATAYAQSTNYTLVLYVTSDKNKFNVYDFVKSNSSWNGLKPLNLTLIIQPQVMIFSSDAGGTGTSVGQQAGPIPAMYFRTNTGTRGNAASQNGFTPGVDVVTVINDGLIFGAMGIPGIGGVGSASCKNDSSANGSTGTNGGTTIFSTLSTLVINNNKIQAGGGGGGGGAGYYYQPVSTLQKCTTYYSGDSYSGCGCLDRKAPYCPQAPYDCSACYCDSCGDVCYPSLGGKWYAPTITFHCNCVCNTGQWGCGSKTLGTYSTTCVNAGYQGGTVYSGNGSSGGYGWGTGGSLTTVTPDPSHVLNTSFTSLSGPSLIYMSFADTKRKWTFSWMTGSDATVASPIWAGPSGSGFREMGMGYSMNVNGCNLEAEHVVAVTGGWAYDYYEFYPVTVYTGYGSYGNYGGNTGLAGDIGFTNYQNIQVNGGSGIDVYPLNGNLDINGKPTGSGIGGNGGRAGYNTETTASQGVFRLINNGTITRVKYSQSGVGNW
jgi:hypothetical protein